MKRILLSLSAIAILGAVSCKKDEDKSSSGSNSWTVNGGTFSPTTSNRAGGDGVISMSDAGGNSLFFYFKTYPTSDGTYKIVRTASPASDEVNIQTLTPPASGGFVTKTGSKTLSVKVSGSKLTLTCSDVPFTYKTTTGDSTTTTLSTNVTEL